MCENKFRKKLSNISDFVFFLKNICIIHRTHDPCTQSKLTFNKMKNKKTIFFGYVSFSKAYNYTLVHMRTHTSFTHKNLKNINEEYAQLSRSPSTLNETEGKKQKKKFLFFLIAFVICTFSQIKIHNITALRYGSRFNLDGWRSFS